MDEPQPLDALRYDAIIERDGLRISRSPWGADDQIGRLNWLTPGSREHILARLDGSEVFDLSVEYFLGMPYWGRAGDPKYQIWMTHTPDGAPLDGASGATDVHRTYSYCGDSIHMYTHCGTHMDTFNHLGYFGCFWNGINAEEHLGSRHWLRGGPENFPPIMARGILLDVAGLHGVACLADDYAIGADDLRRASAEQGTRIERGDVVLVRTGRMTRWPDSEGYLLHSPGIDLGGARYLCEEVGAMCVAADTVGLEVMTHGPEVFRPVHCYMLATAGTPIIEIVDMEEIAAERLYEFAFLAFPLRLRGATGAPLRPVAVPLRR